MSSSLSRLTFISFAALLMASTASAQKATDDAKAHFKRGTELYDEGNYRAALIEFQRAHQLLPNYKLLYNIAQVQLQLLDYARAQEAFSRYLKEGAAEVAPARRDEVTRELDRLKTRVGKIAITTSDGAEIFVDDESMGTAPLAPITANTGRRKVSVVQPGKPPVVRLVDVAGLETVSVNVVLEVPQTAAATTGNAVTQPVEPPPSKVPMIVGWAATAGLAAVAGITAGLAVGASNDLRVLRGMLGVSQMRLNTAGSSVASLAAVADVATVAAIVAGAVSLALTISTLTAKPSVAITIGPTGLGLAAHF